MLYRINNLRWKYVHEVVDHSLEYVRGQVHTNSLENFWSLFKRHLRGTYVAVEPFHLDRYLDEQVYRFNHRSIEGRSRWTITQMIPNVLRFLVRRGEGGGGGVARGYRPGASLTKQGDS